MIHGPLRADPLTRGELLRRSDIARRSLASCAMCELRCSADRSAKTRGRAPSPPPPCGLDDSTWCFKRHISLGEEVELLPSYMVYLGGCNFRCRFCVQAPTCFNPRAGSRIEAAEAAADFECVVQRGARTINLLGGEPSMHLHTLLEIAAAAESPLPLALNTNMYMTPQVIDLLQGVVSLYIADFKFGNDACAGSLAGIEPYVEIIERNLLHAAANAEVIIRHLLMPGHIECCLRPVAEWAAEYLPESRFTLMTGYVPAFRAARDLTELRRCPTQAERRTAEGILKELGIRTGEQ
jgi:putative pyruvate formate lyase activating enzyme